MTGSSFSVYDRVHFVHICCIEWERLETRNSQNAMHAICACVNTCSDSGPHNMPENILLIAYNITHVHIIVERILNPMHMCILQASLIGFHVLDELILANRN